MLAVAGRTCSFARRRSAARPDVVCSDVNCCGGPAAETCGRALLVGNQDTAKRH